MPFASASVVLALVFGVFAQRPPVKVAPELEALLGRTKLQGQIAASCGAAVRPGQPHSFAVAVTTADAGGRYVVIHSDGLTSVLTDYKGRADLSCYSRAEAEKLNRTIRQSATINGEIVPRFDTAVICGFIDDTTAECWQYSPTSQLFMKVGGWTT